MKDPDFKSIAVVGPGLLGGSILKAVRQNLPKCELRIWARRVEVLQYIEDQQLADFATTDVSQAVDGADLIILALPIQHMRSVVEQMPNFPKKVIVTDVGSTKVSVEDDLSAEVAKRGGVFIGSHPMAGSEKTGIEHATADLFAGAAIVVTPPDSSEQQPKIEQLIHFWSHLGGEISLLSAAEHDQVVASISHLPHLVASALTRVALKDRATVYSRLTGGGFRDTTRVAAGDPAMWTGIMLANQQALLGEVDGLIEELTEWRESLAKLDKEALHRFLSEAKEYRETV